MPQKLSDAEIEERIQAIWALTVDEKGVPYEGQTEQGQMALKIVGEIIKTVFLVRLKPEARVLPFPLFRRKKTD